MNSAQKLPIIILSGSDQKPGPVPKGMDKSEMLRGNKGLIELPWGRCLAAELVERIKLSGCFEGPILVGPRNLYQGKVPCEIVDVHGNLLNTLTVVRELVYNRFGPQQPVAFCTNDILPTPEEFRKILEDEYAKTTESAFWCQLVKVDPHRFGASSWKPVYKMAEESGGELGAYFPGHLIVINPSKLRLRLTNHLLQVAYSQRNKGLIKRLLVGFWLGIWRLIVEDFQGILKGKAPILAIGIPFVCVCGVVRLLRKKLNVKQFEGYVAKLLVHREYQNPANFRAVKFSIVDTLSFAKDIDTKGELDEAINAGPVDKRAA